MCADNKVWIIMYAVAMTVLAAGLILVLCKERRLERITRYFLIVFFLAVSCLFFPINLVTKQYSVFEAFFSSLLDGINAVKGSVYSQVNIENMASFSRVYSVSLLVIQTFTFLLTLGAVLTAINYPIQYVKTFFFLPGTVYVLSGADKKVVNVAGSITPSSKGRIIICNPNDKNGVSESANLPYVVQKMKLSLLIERLSRKNKKNITVFLLADDEEQNLCQLREIRDRERKCGTNTSVTVYCEISRLSWNDQNKILSEAGNITVYFIRTDENFAMNNLFNNSVFTTAIKAKSDYLINLLVIGVDEFSIAMIKAALSLAQMPSYFISVLVVDEHAGKSKLRRSFPELCDSMDEIGNARYSFSYFENTGIDTIEFMNVIEEKMPDFTFAFVNLRESVKNQNAVSALKQIRAKKNQVNPCIVQVKENEETFLSGRAEEGMCVQTVGSDKEVYSFSNIVSPEIDRISKMIHDVRQQEKNKDNPTEWAEYAKDEYKRRAVYNRTLSLKYKVSIIDLLYEGDYSLLERDVLWAVYEHMRWNMYMRSIGFCKGESKDEIGKTHTDIVPFSELSDKKKQYDYISLTDEIAAICRRNINEQK